MALSKQAILFQLFAITRSPVDGDLEQVTAEAIATEVDKFSAGKKTKTTGPKLEILLKAITTVVGTDEAQARVDQRTLIDSLTRADKSADTDYVKDFGKEVVRVWLRERNPETSLPKKTTTKKLNAMVVSTKEATWEDEPARETAAIDQAEVDKAAADKARDEQKEAAAHENASTGNGKAPATSKALTITEPVAVFVVSKGKTMTGVLNVDASVTFDTKSENGAVSGKTYSSTSKAACAAMGVKAANGWLRIQFMDGETKKPIDALRTNSRGYVLGAGRRKKVVGVEACQEAITKLEARVEYLDGALVKAKARLEQSRKDLTEAEAAKSKAPADEPTSEIAQDIYDQPSDSTVTPPAAAPEPSANGTRASELKSMKVKALRTIAKELGVKGRSKLKGESLVAAILEAEAAAAA